MFVPDSPGKIRHYGLSEKINFTNLDIDKNLSYCAFLLFFQGHLC